MNLPNWAKLSLGLALVIITWIMNAMSSGQLVLPAAVMTALTVAKTAISMLTDGVPTTRAKMAARAAARVSGILGVFGLMGCGGTAGQVVPVVVPPVVDVAACVIKTVSVDLSKGETLDQAFTDAEDQCLLGHAPSSAEKAANDPTVSKIWGSVVAADEARGLRLPDGGTP